MVHQDGEYAVKSNLPEYAQQDVTGCHHRIGRRTGRTGVSIQVTGLGIKQFQHRGPVQEGDIYAAVVWRIVVDILVVQLPEKGLCQYLPENESILHLLQADDLRQPARFRADPQQGLRESVRLGLEPLPGPMPLPCRRKLSIRYRRGIVPPIEEVLHVPEHHFQGISTCRYRLFPRALHPL